MYLKFLQLGEAIAKVAKAAVNEATPLSFSEVRLLEPLLSNLENGLTRAQLAEKCHLTPSAVSRALTSLEKEGLVHTQQGVRDSRESRSILTPTGQSQLQLALKELDTIFGSFSIPHVDSSEITNVINQINIQHLNYRFSKASQNNYELRPFTQSLDYNTAPRIPAKPGIART